MSIVNSSNYNNYIKKLSDYPNFLEGLAKVNRPLAWSFLALLSPGEIERVGQCSKALHSVSKGRTLWEFQAKKWGVSQISEDDDKKTIARKMKAGPTFHINGHPLPDELTLHILSFLPFLELGDKGRISKQIHAISQDESLQPNNFGDYHLPAEVAQHIFSFLSSERKIVGGRAFCCQTIENLCNLQMTSKPFNLLSKEILQKSFLRYRLEYLFRDNVPAHIVKYYLNVHPNAITDYDSNIKQDNILNKAFFYNASPQLVELLLENGAKATEGPLWELDVFEWVLKRRPSLEVMKSLLEVSPTRMTPFAIRDTDIAEVTALCEIYKDWDDLKYAVAAYKLGLDGEEAENWWHLKDCISFDGTWNAISSGEELLCSQQFQLLGQTTCEDKDITNYLNKIKKEVLCEAIKKGFCAESIVAIIERGTLVDENMVSFAIANNASPEVIQVLKKFAR